MLTFADQPGGIKIFKLVPNESGEVSRVALGTIKKKDMSHSKELADLSREDESQLRRILDFYEKREESRISSLLYNFPETTRELVDHTAEHGDEFEKQAVIMVLMEGLRVMRKARQSASHARPLLSVVHSGQ